MSSEAEEQEIQRQEDGCDCYIIEDTGGRDIVQCPLHQAAESLFNALEDLATRAERARKILQESSRGGNWGMLDTKSVRTILTAAKGEEVKP